ncbi:COG3476 Tryptophan-rich sensory protein (mitochondrial benzodiazepine receptor homolog) [Oxalobacteraceae bacterium]
MIRLAPASKKPTLIAVLLVLVVGGIGGAATEIGPWYLQLVKPSWQPPDWAFGPVWTLLYITTSIAGVRAWRNADAQEKKYFLAAVLMNCVLNILWSVLFFKLHRPDLALMEVGALWLSVLILTVLPWSYSRASTWLMVPHLFWVSTAACLNLSIVKLNGPF